MDENEKLLIINTCQGNPGCLTVLIEMNKKNSLVASLLMNQLRATDSKAPHVWQVYKDGFDCDIDKTFKLFADYINYPGTSLKEYVINKKLFPNVRWD